MSPLEAADCMSRTLVVMAKAPVPRDVKTRLCPPLDHQTAAQLHWCFVKDTLEKLSSLSDVEIAIAFTPKSALLRFQAIAPWCRRFLVQTGKDLGERMLNCFRQLCDPGRSVAIVGSDAPTLPVGLVDQAFESLSRGTADVVVGPCSDGGYYLIGMNVPIPQLFRDIDWSTPTVLDKTIALLTQMHVRYDLLPEWYDVDTPEELARLVDEILSPGGSATSVRNTAAFLTGLVERGTLPRPH